MTRSRKETDKSNSERAESLLKTLIERYIQDGQPIGSRALARDSELDLSPATIRNVMSDLEEMGLILAPHTSAGRVPTDKGYRMFVDSLLTVKPMQDAVIETIKQQLATSATTDSVISNASSMLSEITQLTGVVTMPRREQVRLEHIEFLKLSPKRILVILVVNGQEVQNRVIDTERDFTASELTQSANYLNAEFAGQDLASIRKRLVSSMQQARDSMQKLMQDTMNLADEVLDSSKNDDYILAGQTNLMGYDEMCDIDKLRNLFEAFNSKRDILHILDQSIQAEGMQIFIGGESGYKVLDDVSVVTAPYKVDDEVIGVLGVIGPTRMAYDRVIPIVDVTAKVLGAILRPD
ncbi:Heat-inducible transcription repressor HrcA [hydrothermal vent metagenome]|uniref:Heat-inducible transcription repressor HrcA n=1 Tax=hydrothermal vent metagenome TaxID=652676 RepID=A0A3B0ZGP7_9ZZZZ